MTGNFQSRSEQVKKKKKKQGKHTPYPDTIPASKPEACSSIHSFRTLTGIFKQVRVGQISEVDILPILPRSATTSASKPKIYTNIHQTLEHSQEFFKQVRIGQKVK